MHCACLRLAPLTHATPPSRLQARPSPPTAHRCELLLSLRHPNIVAYRDAFRTPEVAKLTIVMEHAAGGDLGSLITKRAQAGTRFTEPEVLKILSQSVDALGYCHGELHLLHRDLKPENIFLSAAGDVRMALAATGVGAALLLLLRRGVRCRGGGRFRNTRTLKSE